MTINPRPRYGDLGRLQFIDALALHVANVSTRDIARAAGVNRTSVNSWRRRNNLTPRPCYYKHPPRGLKNESASGVQPT